MIKLLSLLLFWSLPAHAFVFINNGGYNIGSRPVANAPMWAGRTLTFYVNTNQSIMGGSISPELSTAEFQSAITTAVAEWNNTCGSNLTVVVAGTTTNTKTTGDSVNTIMWDNRTTGEGNYAADSSTLAFANPAMTSDTVVDCDIVVNGEASGDFAIDGNSSDYDLVSTLAHEIGHCLGLDHTVSSPTYTSSNSILTNALMNSTLSAGDISKRSLSQDEVDSMECVNPSTSGYSARGGYFCTSYHGSNGGAALSGVISGGPSSSRTCGDGQSAAVTKSTSSGGGCVSNAFADENEQSGSGEIGWLYLFPLLALFFFRKRIFRFFLGSLFALSLSPSAEAAVEFSYSITRANPSAIEKASEFTSAEGTFSSTAKDPETPFKSFNDLYGAISYNDTAASSWGLFYQKILTEKSGLTGKNSGGTVLVRKNSSLDAWLVGIARKYNYWPQQARSLNGFFELQLAGGSATYGQTIIDSNSTTHRIEGSAFILEANAYLGLQYPVWSMLDGLVKVGYSRMHSNYFAVTSVSGSRYGSLKAGDRMAVRSGQDLRLVRDGFSVQLGLTYSLGGGGGGAAPIASE